MLNVIIHTENIIYLFNFIYYMFISAMPFLCIYQIACIQNIFRCTIGRTSRATFGIPAKRLNITIYPIL